LSSRQIAASLQVSRSSVGEFVRRVAHRRQNATVEPRLKHEAVGAPAYAKRKAPTRYWTIYPDCFGLFWRRRPECPFQLGQHGFFRNIFSDKFVKKPSD
jgi:hypothetical protein